MEKLVQQTPQPRYAIGIDLGTSHCALAYKSLDGEGPLKVLEITQWDSETTLTKSTLLPSWFYFIQKSEIKKGLFQKDLGVTNPYVVGRLARAKGPFIPGRVVHSAKSWFCANQVDRTAKILPWASSEVIGQERLSPVDIAAAYLCYLKDQWNEQFAGEEAWFEYQQITITVPASFDEVAQRLTLDAASKLRCSTSIKLLEEPQAAFYAWLAEHTSQEQQIELGIQSGEEKTILVCDVGGGTSDFSLFKSRLEGEVLSFERVGVSDHLLLGGDNIDLALAHHFEMQIGPSGSLSHKVFSSLTHSVRTLKEELFKSDQDVGLEQTHSIGLVVGESLFGSTKSVSIQKQKMLDLISEGFFPKVTLDQRPHKSKGGLKQLGLPYAEDSAITKHLAEFLSAFLLKESPQGPKKTAVDAVLMVGGTLKPAYLQQKLLEQITAWQEIKPGHLTSSSMDLAVAQGAALYGYSQFRAVQGIESGYPRSVYLEIQKEQSSVLVCLMEKGFRGFNGPSRGSVAPWMQSGALKAWINRPVKFQLWTSRVRPGDKPGDLIQHKTDQIAGEFSMLPSLMTTLKVDGGSFQNVKNRPALQEEQIPVSLNLYLADTGVLSVHCVPLDPRQAPLETEGGLPQDGWPLDFNLRVESSESFVDQETNQTNVSANEAVLVPESVIQGINLVYGKNIEEKSPGPKSLIKDLEKMLGLAREQWSVELLRVLWSHLSRHATRRGRSPSHESTWLYLAGYCLRPGYGHSHDESKVSSLWRQTNEGLAFPKERSVQEQLWIMQRRICGGLGAEDQTKILAKLMPMIRKGEVPSAEVYKLAASLERADQTEKIKLGAVLAQQIHDNRPQFMDDKIWALARIASRVMLFAEPEHIVQPSFVEIWCKQIGGISVKDKRYPRLNLFWAFAARRVLEREFSLCEEIMAIALKRLEESKAPVEQREVVEKFLAVDYRLKVRLFGESLPLGLTFYGI